MKHFLFSATFEMICDTPYIVQESGKERSIKSFFCQMSTFVYTVCKHFGETHHHSWHHNCLQSLWHLEESQCVCASPPAFLFYVNRWNEFFRVCCTNGPTFHEATLWQKSRLQKCKKHDICENSDGIEVTCFHWSFSNSERRFSQA